MNLKLGLGVGLVVAGFVTVVACNRGTGFCPGAETIQPGAQCVDDDLQCAYSLTTPNPACDGTTTTVDTSCTCANGFWSCPDPVDCSAADDDAGDQDSGDQDAGDQGDATPQDDAGGDP